MNVKPGQIFFIEDKMYVFEGITKNKHIASVTIVKLGMDQMQVPVDFLENIEQYGACPDEIGTSLFLPF